MCCSIFYFSGGQYFTCFWKTMPSKIRQCNLVSIASYWAASWNMCSSNCCTRRCNKCSFLSSSKSVTVSLFIILITPFPFFFFHIFRKSVRITSHLVIISFLYVKLDNEDDIYRLLELNQFLYLTTQNSIIETHVLYSKLLCLINKSLNLIF